METHEIPPSTTASNHKAETTRPRTPPVATSGSSSAVVAEDDGQNTKTSSNDQSSSLAHKTPETQLAEHTLDKLAEVGQNDDGAEPSEQSGQRMQQSSTISAESETEQNSIDFWTSLLHYDNLDHGSDTRTVHVYLSWSDGSHSSGIRWKMCDSICKSALNGIKEHVMSRHNCELLPEGDNNIRGEGMPDASKWKEESGKPLAGGLYPCRSPNCEQTFDMKSELLSHESEQHDNGNVFRCSHCNKTFNHNSHYTRHVLIHTQRQQCKMCHKVFKNKRSLMQHQTKKHGRTSKEGAGKIEEQGVTMKPLSGDGVKSEQQDKSCADDEEGGADELLDAMEEGHAVLKHRYHNDDTGTDTADALRVRRPRRIRLSFRCSICSYKCARQEHLTRHIAAMHEGDDEEENADYDDESDGLIDNDHDDDADYDVKAENNVSSTAMHSYGSQVLTEDPANLSADILVRISTANSDDDAKFMSGEVPVHAVAKDCNSFHCGICGKSFGSKGHLQRHRAMHGRTVQQKCRLCWKVCKNVVGLRRHMRRTHPGTKPPSLTQDLDSAEDSGTDGSESNSALDDVDRPPQPGDGSLVRYPCRSSDCKEAFTLLHQRVQHEKKHHNGRPLECKICFKTFGTQCHYTRHMGVHTERQTCGVCQKICKNANSLRKHRLIHVNGGAVCQFCGKTFHDKASMKTHEKIHTNDKKYQCDYCDKRFIKVSDKRIHEQRHTGFQFVCMHCGHGCATKSLLENHEAIHTGLRPYECEECHKKFRTAGQLYNHKPLHTEGRFTCTMCSKRFRWKCDLKTHVRIHLGQRPHKCDKCDKRFVDVSNKLAHMKQVHMGIKRTGHGKRGKRKQNKVAEGAVQTAETTDVARSTEGSIYGSDTGRGIHRAMDVDSSLHRNIEGRPSLHNDLDVDLHRTTDNIDDVTIEGRTTEGSLQRSSEGDKSSLERTVDGGVDLRQTLHNIHRSTNQIDSILHHRLVSHAGASQDFTGRSDNIRPTPDDIRPTPIHNADDLMRQPPCGSTNNTYRPPPDTMASIGKPLQTYDGTPVSSAPLYPTMLYRSIPGGEHRLPRSGDHPDRPPGPPDDSARPPHNDFYSMVQTLIQFSKDS